MDKNDSSLIMHHVMMIAFFKCVVCNIRAINEETSNVLKEEMILRPYSTIDGKAVCEQCRLADSDRNRECNLGNIHRIILQYFCMFYLSGKYIKNSSMAQISKGIKGFSCPYTNCTFGSLPQTLMQVAEHMEKCTFKLQKCWGCDKMISVGKWSAHIN